MRYWSALFILFLLSCPAGGSLPAQVFTLAIQVVGKGTVNSDPAGIQCTTGNQGTCARDFAQGTQVTLTATPEAGWQFAGWGGDADCVDGQVMLNANLTCTATFAQGQHTLDVTIQGQGSVTSNPAGINCPGDCSEVYAPGTQVTLTANPDPGWRFDGWAGHPDCADGQVALSEDILCTAVFSEIQYTLDVTIQGQGSITSNPAGIQCPGDCSESYAEGTQVTLTATPGAGWQFDGWSGDCAGNAPNVQVTLDADRACTATFVQQIVYTLSITIQGSGTVTSNPAGINCPGDCSEAYAEGTQVTLTATPDPGWQLDRWAGDADCADGQVTLNMDLTCTAVFARASVTWARSFRGDASDQAYSLERTNDGGLIVAGETWSFDAVENDAWLVKLDSAGNVQWEKTYGGLGWDGVQFVDQTSDGGFVAGGWTASYGAGETDFWVLRLDGTGNVIWQKTYGSIGWETVSSLQQTQDGGYIVAGITDVFGAGWREFLLLKLDPQGNVVWQRTYGGPGGEWAPFVQQTADGGFILAGETASFGAGGSDVWVLRLQQDGTVVWQKTYGGSGADSATAVQETSDGGFIVVGWTASFGAGGEDFWVLKLDASGNVEWQKTYGGTGDERANAVKQTPDGGYIVAGSTTSFGAGGNDFWLVRLDGAGNVIWEKSYGGADEERARALVLMEDGGFVVAGWTVSFGQGGEDFWVLRVDTEGNVSGCQAGDMGVATRAEVTITAISGVSPNITVTAAGVSSHDSNARIADSAAGVETQCG